MKLYLAPLQGMTNAIYRQLFHKYFGGIDAYYAPFIDITAPNHASDVHFKDMLAQANSGDHHVVPQLLGNHGENFRYYANRLTDMGYDEVNWNIGCPYPTVTRKSKGSGILSDPDMVDALLKEACKDTHYKLTVKMRLGMTDLEEGLDVIEVLNKYPLHEVTIHARTGQQKYAGSVNLDAFETMIKDLKHPVVYNGDVFTLEDYHHIITRFPQIRAVMLGRGALKDPFLPSTIKGRTWTPDEKMTTAKAFHHDLYKHYEQVMAGDKHLTDRLKEFWSYWGPVLDPQGKAMKKIKKCKTKQEYLQAVDLLFNTSQGWE